MQPPSPRPGYFGRTLDLGLLDRIMMTQDAVLPTRDIIFGATLARGGFEVKRPLVKDGESWQRGAAESRQRAQTEGTHGEEVPFGALVASSAGPTKFIRISILKMARWLDSGGDYCSVYLRCLLNVC
jgi:hypothetical protein